MVCNYLVNELASGHVGVVQEALFLWREGCAVVTAGHDVTCRHGPPNSEPISHSHSPHCCLCLLIVCPSLSVISHASGALTSTNALRDIPPPPHISKSERLSNHAKKESALSSQKKTLCGLLNAFIVTHTMN